MRIYTDGAAEPNPGRGGYAAIILDDETETRLVGSEHYTTNNRMELMAAIVALEALGQRQHLHPIVTVVSDSQYLVYGASRWMVKWKKRGWLRVLNRDLWERLDAILIRLEPRIDVRFEWVRGHAGNPYNELVDTLANQMART